MAPSTRETQGPLAATACRLCREQKVRCSHEQPTCARCSKLNLECAYPEPPDRKLIAARREQSKKRPAWDSQVGSNPSGGLQKRLRSIQDDPEEYSRPPIQAPIFVDQAAMKSLPEPSPEAAQVLQTAYFTSTFNSSLTFHYPSFKEDEANGTVPKHTLLAMQALGANFIVPLSTRGKQHYAVMKSLGDLRCAADSWALAAGKLALQEADEPTLYMVRTCQMLSLFWFSRGDSRRNTMFSGIGYKAVRAIIVESIDKVKATPGNESLASSPAQSCAHDVECLRRLFWASWTTNIINSDHYVPGSAADTLVWTLPLPISDSAFLQQKEEPLATISVAFATTQPSSRRPAREPSIMAEIMKCLIIWARIRDHIDLRRNFPEKEPWHHIYSIQKDIDVWRRQLHPDLRYSKRNLYHQLVVKQQPTFVMFHAIHHQSVLVLNSALVPHFSGIPMPQDMPFEVVRVSAALVLQSARALANISAHLIALEWDPTQIAPFFGYCMYASASMQISALPRRRGTGSQAWESLTNCMKLLKMMKPYWAVLERLWTRILPLYETQMANFRRAAATLPEVSRSTQEDEDDDSAAAAEDEEFLTSPQGDTSNPQDSTETSALQYSLRTLPQDAPTSSERSSTQVRDTTSMAAVETDRTFAPETGNAKKVVFADPGEARHQNKDQEHDSETNAAAASSAVHLPVNMNGLPQDPLYNQAVDSAVSFEPFQIAFQDSFPSLDALDMAGLEDNDWLQLDMDSSSQARQAFNHLF
ncbi:hypothetical protein CC79DRAFT_1328403 [Sarocladium strictum]